METHGKFQSPWNNSSTYAYLILFIYPFIYLFIFYLHKLSNNFLFLLRRDCLYLGFFSL